jgi:hypothetical protein
MFSTVESIAALTHRRGNKRVLAPFFLRRRVRDEGEFIPAFSNVLF